MLRVIIGEQKSNFSGKFKLEPIITYHLWLTMKVLWKCCGPSISQILNIEIGFIPRKKKLILSIKF